MALIRDTSIRCIQPLNKTHTQSQIVVCAVLGISSIAGLSGALLQLQSVWRYQNRQRQKPSANPRIIFNLALSDLIACLGVVTLSILAFFQDMVHVGPDEKIHPYKVLVFLMEGITVFSFLASYIWTFSFALDMCFQIYHIDCQMIVYGIVSWLIPLDIIICYQWLNHGNGIESGNVSCDDLQDHVRKSRLILSYIVVVFVMLGNPFLFVIIHKKIKKMLRTSSTYTDTDRKALGSLKKKFFQITFVFALCWFPNIISVSYELNKGKRLSAVFVIEALLNPLQGLLNYFVYRKAFRVNTRGPTNQQGSQVGERVLRSVQLPSTCRPAQQRNIHSPSIRICRSNSVPYQTSLSEPNERTQLVRPRSTPREPGCSHSYVCRLLGE